MIETLIILADSSPCPTEAKSKVTGISQSNHPINYPGGRRLDRRRVAQRLVAANFRNVDLRDAQLADANMRDADFTDCKKGQLPGTALMTLLQQAG